MHPSNPWDASQETVREQVDLLQLHLEVVRLEVVDLLIRRLEVVDLLIRRLEVVDLLIQRLEVVDLLIRSLPTPSSGHGPHQKDRKRPSRPKDEPKSKKVRKKLQIWRRLKNTSLLQERRNGFGR